MYVKLLIAPVIKFVSLLFSGTRLSADNHTCADVDECEQNNGGCAHICLNTFGQIFCTCRDGYLLGMDWKSCNGSCVC